MATKTKKAKKSKGYKVSYKGTVKAIKLLEKRLTAIRGKVSDKSKINADLEVVKKCEAICSTRSSQARRVPKTPLA